MPGSVLSSSTNEPAASVAIRSVRDRPRQPSARCARMAISCASRVDLVGHARRADLLRRGRVVLGLVVEERALRHDLDERQRLQLAVADDAGRQLGADDALLDQHARSRTRTPRASTAASSSRRDAMLDADARALVRRLHHDRQQRRDAVARCPAGRTRSPRGGPSNPRGPGCRRPRTPSSPSPCPWRAPTPACPSRRRERPAARACPGSSRPRRTGRAAPGRRRRCARPPATATAPRSRAPPRPRRLVDLGLERRGQVAAVARRRERSASRAAERAPAPARAARARSSGCAPSARACRA